MVEGAAEASGGVSAWTTGWLTGSWGITSGVTAAGDSTGVDSVDSDEPSAKGAGGLSIGCSACGCSGGEFSAVVTAASGVESAGAGGSAETSAEADSEEGSSSRGAAGDSLVTAEVFWSEEADAGAGVEAGVWSEVAFSSKLIVTFTLSSSPRGFECGWLPTRPALSQPPSLGRTRVKTDSDFIKREFIRETVPRENSRDF